MTATTSIFDRAAGPPGREPGPDAGTMGTPEFRVVRTGATLADEFTAFVREATPALARTAWLLCGDEHQADELVQRALTRTYLKWSTARDRDPLAYARRVLATLTHRQRRIVVLRHLVGLSEREVAEELGVSSAR